MARRVRDLMHSDAAVVREEDSVKDVARKLSESGTGALPVIDSERHVVGVVSEADLILKDERRVSEPWPLERRARREARRKMRASSAGELMSAPATVIAPEADVADLARFMRERRLKFVPVCDWDGTLLGAISRLDLVSEFLRDDLEIAEEVRRIVHAEMSLPELRCIVTDGVVTLEGAVEHRSQVAVIVERIHRVAGVIEVVNRMRWTDDDHPHVRPSPWSALDARAQWQEV